MNLCFIYILSLYFRQFQEPEICQEEFKIPLRPVVSKFELQREMYTRMKKKLILKSFRRRLQVSCPVRFASNVTHNEFSMLFDQFR